VSVGDSAPPWKGAQQPPPFGPRTVAHLSNCWALVADWQTDRQTTLHRPHLRTKYCDAV